MKTFEYKLKPNKTQVKQLENVLELTRNLYNKCLEELVEFYNENGKQMNRFAQDKLHNTKTDPNIYSPLVDTTVARIHRTFSDFYRRIKNNQKAGFPRFKSYNRWRSIVYRDYVNNRLDGNKFISGGKVAGNIKIFSNRKLEGKPKCSTIVKKASGWYLQIHCEVENNILPKTNNEIGLDVGIKYLIADSNGNFIENDRTYRKKLKKLRILQRSLSRKIKGSNRRKKQIQKLNRFHEGISNKRSDYLHKITTNIVKNNDLIVMEDLNIKNMLKNHCLALSISDASWGIIKNMLSYKAENAGRKFVCINPRFTSQKCSKCGEIVVKSLSIRTHICPHCGFTADRDTNASLNILKLGRSFQEVNYAKA